MTDQQGRRQAARYVHSDWRRHSSPTAMIQQLKWQSLEHRRHTARLTTIYKIQQGLVDIPLSKYTQPARTHTTNGSMLPDTSL